MSSIVQPRAEVYRPHDSVEATRLPIKDNAPFTLVHYPGAWEWDDTLLDFLPCLSEVSHRPGVNGIGDDGKPTRALGGAVGKGGTLIPPGDARLGKWRNYVTRYATTNGKYYYCFAGTTFAILPGGQARPVDGSTNYRAFRQHLVKSGILAPIDPISYNALEDATARRIARISNRMQGRHTELEEATRDALVAQLKRMREWWKANGAPMLMDSEPQPGEQVLTPEVAPAESISAEEIAAAARSRTGAKSDGKLTLGGS